MKTRLGVAMLAGVALSCATPGGLRLTWLGGPTTALEAGDGFILTDPMLGAAGADAFVLPQHPSTGEPDAGIDRFVDPPEFDVSRVKVVLLSHGHADHFDAAARAKLSRAVVVVCPEGLVDALRAAGFEQVIGLRWGSKTALRIGDLKLTVDALEAHHAHEAPLDARLGVVNAYRLSLDQGTLHKTVYWSGDTVTTDAEAFSQPLDLALIHLGAVGADGALGRRSMNAAEGIALVRRLKPGVAVPIHHSTFGHYREDIAVFAHQALAEGLPVRVLREGQSLVLH